MATVAPLASTSTSTSTSTSVSASSSSARQAVRPHSRARAHSSSSSITASSSMHDSPSTQQPEQQQDAEQQQQRRRHPTTKPKRVLSARRRPLSAHASMCSATGIGGTGFAPTSTLRPALPLSIDVSVAQIALPPSSLIHKPAMVLPIVLDSDDNIVTQDQDPAASTTTMTTTSIAQEKGSQQPSQTCPSPSPMRTSASSPSLFDYRHFARLSSSDGTGSANVTPRPPFLNESGSDETVLRQQQQQQQQQQHLNASSAASSSHHSARPQQEVLALLSASTLDTEGIITSSPMESSNSSAIMSRSNSTLPSPTSVLDVDVLRTAVERKSGSMNTSRTSSTCNSWLDETSVHASYRPFYHRSPSVTSFASDGSWHGDAGDWNPEEQLKTAADKAISSSCRPVPANARCCRAAQQPQQPARRQPSFSSNPIFRTIGNGLGMVSSRVQRSHQRQQDGHDGDGSEHSDDDDDDDDDDDEIDISSASDSLFSSIAPSQRNSFSYSQSELGETSSVSSGRSHHRFRAIGQGLTPLKPQLALSKQHLQPAATAEDADKSSSTIHLATSPLGSGAMEGLSSPISPAQGSESRFQTARDSIKEHAGPFIWLLANLLDPVSESLSNSTTSLSRSSPSPPAFASPELGLDAVFSATTDAAILDAVRRPVDDDSEIVGAEDGSSKKQRSWARRSKEEYLFGPRSAWAALRAEADPAPQQQQQQQLSQLDDSKTSTASITRAGAAYMGSATTGGGGAGVLLQTVDV
ncbi:hypothetical protein OC834_007077 [Tilletia horrida]|nr:hypothetical protein OC834_007077 [Tilletia horrida]